jgi:uncharacterized protein YdcH (DUF465 family)
VNRKIQEHEVEFQNLLNEIDKHTDSIKELEKSNSTLNTNVTELRSTRLARENEKKKS